LQLLRGLMCHITLSELCVFMFNIGWLPQADFYIYRVYQGTFCVYLYNCTLNEAHSNNYSIWYTMHGPPFIAYPLDWVKLLFNYPGNSYNENTHISGPAICQ
jgi:hypothetical protein